MCRLAKQNNYAAKAGGIMQRLKFIFSILIVFAATPAENFSFPKQNKEGSQLLQTNTLEDFEKPDSWIVKYSRFRKHTWKESALKTMEPSLKWISWKTMDPKSPDYRLLAKPEPPGKEGAGGRTIMGVRGKFYTRGYNWIAVEPSQDLFLYGKVQRLRVWVWGGNFNYNLYIVFKNFRNQHFQVKLGNLRFLGWKQLHIDFKNYNLGQVDSWAPQNKPLQFVRFLIVSDVMESPDFFGIWFDDIRYDTDLYDQLFPGKALETEFDWE